MQSVERTEKDDFRPENIGFPFRIRWTLNSPPEQAHHPRNMVQDKQLYSVTIDQVVEKRRLGQALNAKEFAVLAGISYSAAREWFRLPGFPVFRGLVFWEDFTDWRRAQAHLSA